MPVLRHWDRLLRRVVAVPQGRGVRSVSRGSVVPASRIRFPFLQTNVRGLARGCPATLTGGKVQIARIKPSRFPWVERRRRWPTPFALTNTYQARHGFLSPQIWECPREGIHEIVTEADTFMRARCTAACLTHRNARLNPYFMCCSEMLHRFANDYGHWASNTKSAEEAPDARRVLITFGDYYRFRLHVRPASPTSPEPRRSAVPGSGTEASPLSENAALNVGGGVPPTMSVPTRSQSGSRAASRVHACRSGVNGVPGGTIGFGADSHRKSPVASSTCGTKK